MSNSLDPDQAQQNVGPELGPNCLQRLSADNTSKQKVKTVFYKEKQIFCLFELMLNIQVNNFSVMSGKFTGLNPYIVVKIKFFAQEDNTVSCGRFEPATSWSQA